MENIALPFECDLDFNDPAYPMECDNNNCRWEATVGQCSKDFARPGELFCPFCNTICRRPMTLLIVGKDYLPLLKAPDEKSNKIIYLGDMQFEIHRAEKTEIVDSKFIYSAIIDRIECPGVWNVPRIADNDRT